ncbi:MAG: efflux RND transporter periplasmic adaptor subunit [Rubrivivax sp.]|nr:efflux RND transporter periplasmic adaptor subunit [Rubrivivax sp.]
MSDAVPAPTPSSPAAPAPTLASLQDARTAPLRRRRRRWPWVLLALLLVGAGAAVMAPRSTEVQASTVATAWPTARFAQLNASGYVVAQRRASVASKATGRLVELRVREGSALKAGDLIARLDASDVQAAIAAAEAALAQARAGQAQADAQLRQAQVELGNADAELQRIRGLEQQGFVSPQALDATRRCADSARAALALAQAGIASARAGQAQALAQLQAQRVNRDNTEVRAPFDGVVLVKNANVGDMITPFSSAAGTSGAVVTMADMGTLEVEADVAEANVGLVRIDQPVEITLDALPEARFRGSVARIVPTVDRAKATVMTKVRFERLDPRILPEMSAKVAFLSQAPGPGDDRPVTAVNPKTVVQRDGRALVFRIQGDTVEAVPVTTGRTLGDTLELTGATLKPGDRLVLSPPEQLKAGAREAVTGK